MIPFSDHGTLAPDRGWTRRPLVRRLFAAATLTLGLTAVACASRQMQVSGVDDSGNMVARLNTANGSFDFQASTDGAARSDTLPETPDKLWPLLEPVYDSLAIPVRVRNPEAGVLGSVDFSATRRLGDQRLSLYLDCGRTITGSMADQGEITMTVVTQIRPADLSGDRGRVTTLVKGTARQHGLSSSQTDCTSTGRLEHLIATRLQLLALKNED